jgi:aldehyde:ferredoxin oxidoreductase
VTGIEYNLHDILKVGARAQTLGRIFNFREGFTADDDMLPRRVMKAFKRGPLADVEIDPAKFAWAKERFYELMQWNPNTGAPTQNCIEDLELTALLEDIHK